MGLLIKARGNLFSTENFALEDQEKLKLAVEMWNMTESLQCKYNIDALQELVAFNTVLFQVF